MPHQSGIGGRPNSAKQNQVKIILIGDNFEVIAWLKPAACPNRLGNYKLAALAHIGRQYDYHT